MNISDIDKSKQQDLISLAEKQSKVDEMNDQSRYLIDQKLEVLRSIN